MSTINSQLLQSLATIIKDLYLNIASKKIKKEKINLDLNCFCHYSLCFIAINRFASTEHYYLVKFTCFWCITSCFSLAIISTWTLLAKSEQLLCIKFNDLKCHILHIIHNLQC